MGIVMELIRLGLRYGNGHRWCLMYNEVEILLAPQDYSNG